MTGQSEPETRECADNARMQASPPQKTVIIGCNGRMGKMLLERANEVNLKAEGIDRTVEEACLPSVFTGADLALFCVPVQHLASSLRKLAPYMAPDAIVADITSVKEKPIKEMENIWKGPVVGTHPLFGPKNGAQGDFPVAIMPGATATEGDLRKTAAFFGAMGFRAWQTTAERHDRAMSKIQNLNFITNVAYFASLAGQNDLIPFLTPSFWRRHKAAAKMLTEDGDMFCDLFEANSYSQEAARKFRAMLDLAASGDMRLLCERARWWFKDGEN